MKPIYTVNGGDYPGKKRITEQEVIYNIFSSTTKINTKDDVVTFKNVDGETCGLNYTYLLSILKKNIEMNMKETVELFQKSGLDNLECYSKFLTMIVITSKIFTSLKTNTESYKKFEEEIDNIFEQLKESIGEDSYYRGFASALYKDINTSKLLNKNARYGEDDIIAITKHFLTPDDIYNRQQEFIFPLMCTDKQIFKKAKSAGLFSKIEGIEFSEEFNFDDIKEYNYFIQYLSKRSIYILFFKEGKISRETLEANMNIKDLFAIGLTLEEVLEALERKVLRGDLTKRFIYYWQKGIVSMEIIDHLRSLGYISYDSIINLYRKDKSHKLANELNTEMDNSSNMLSEEEMEKSIVSDDFIMEYFNPRNILYIIATQKLSEKEDNNKITVFLKNDIGQAYREASRELGPELLKSIRDLSKKDVGFSEGMKYIGIYQLYILGLINIRDLEIGDLEKEQFIELCNFSDVKDEELIYLYNLNIISPEYIFENYEIDRILELINKGLNPEVLLEYVGTNDILSYIYKLQLTDLSVLRPCINIEAIKELYKSEQLSYEDLDLIMKFKLITLEEFDKIQNEYDVEKELFKLMEIGVISGNEQEGLSESRRFKPHETDDNSKKVKRAQLTTSDKSKNEFYNSLDKEYISLSIVNGPYKGYEVIVFKNLKVALLEYSELTDKQGGSVVLPIKVVLEQVKPTSEEDIIRNAKTRTELKKNKFARPAVHTKNWAVNVIKKMAETNPMIDAKALISENRKIINKINDQLTRKNDETKNVAKVSNQNIS